MSPREMQEYAERLTRLAKRWDLIRDAQAHLSVDGAIPPNFSVHTKTNFAAYREQAEEVVAMWLTKNWEKLRPMILADLAAEEQRIAEQFPTPNGDQDNAS